VTGAAPARASPGVALGATLAIQVYTSLAGTATAVLAPAIAADLAVPARWIGAYVGLVYLGAMAASLLSGAYIARHGAIRVSQACVALCAIGIAGTALVQPGAIAIAVVAAIVLGTGYGPITPASSHVLARTTPPSRMSLVFSIKQTGVPAGAALAGAALPAASLVAGWRWAFAAVAVIGVVVILAAQPIRRALDTGLKRDADAAIGRAFAAVGHVLRDSRIAPLAVLSFAYAATQVSLTSFLVVHLTGALGWSLVAAGLALSVGTIGGVAGRIAWGAVSDRTQAPRAVLGIIGLVAGACATLTALATPGWPAIAIYVVVAAFGATAIGWNGVMLAEVARLAPAGEAGAMTGTTGFITFGGVVAGPTLFAVLSAVAGSTRAGFFAVALLSGITGAVLLVRKASPRRS
jgi:MFS family permease